MVREDLDNLIIGIQNKKIKKINDQSLTEEDFLYQGRYSKCLLDYINEYKVEVEFSIVSRIQKDPRIVEKCLFYESNILYRPFLSEPYYFSSSFDKRTFKTVLSDGITLLEYFFKYKHPTKHLIQKAASKDVIDLCKKYGREDLYAYISEYILFDGYPNNSFIEKLFKEKYSNLPKLISNIKRDTRIIDLINKYNPSLITNVISEKILFCKEDDKTYFENLFNKNKITPNIISNLHTHIEAIDLFKKNNKLYMLKDANSDFMFKGLSRGHCLFDDLAQANLLTDKICMDIYGSEYRKYAVGTLIENKRYEYLPNIPDHLLKRIDNNKRVIDLIYERYDKYNDTYLAKINDAFKCHPSSIHTKAKLYINLIDHDLIECVDLSVSNLLDNEGKITLLDEMLEESQDSTLKALTTTSSIKNPSIIFILNRHGIKTNRINVPIEHKKFKAPKIYPNKQIKEETTRLLHILRKLFEKDGISSQDIINMLINSYRNLAESDYPYTNFELMQLINLKLEDTSNSKFTLQKTTSSSNFRPRKKILYMEGQYPKILDHELAHALHYMIDNGKTPEGYEEIVSRLRNDKETLKKAKTFSIRFSKLEEELLDKTERLYEEEISKGLNKEKLQELNNLLEEKKNDVISSLQDRGYNYSEVEKEVNDIFDIDIDDYFKEYKIKKKEEFSKRILMTDIHLLGALSDMIDAVYEGRGLSSLLYDGNKPFRLYLGHGIKYYCEDYHGFDEMLANYIEIIKDPTSKEVITYMRYILGDELIDLLDNYYKTSILKLQNNLEKEKTKTL